MAQATANEQPDTTGHDDPPGTARRNYRLAVASGAFGTAGFDCIHPELILVGLVLALTGSVTLAALVTVISKAGILAPQLLVGTRLEHRHWKRPYFVGFAVLRLAALAAMAVAIAMLGRGVTPWRLTLFFGAYLASCLCMGSGYVVFMDIVGRMIPTGRVGTFIGMRHFAGGAASVVIGLAVIQPVLAHIPTPTNYLVLACLGVALGAVHTVLFGLCREPVSTPATSSTTLGQSLRRGFGWLKTDRNYRIFLALRVTFRINYLGLAFFIPYGKELAAERDPAAIAILGGIMVAVHKVCRTFSSLVWGRLADGRGYRSCLVAAGVFFTVAPALALLAPHLPRGFAVAIPGTGATLDLPLAVYLLGLGTLGAAFQGLIVGGNRFLITSAPPHRRISYVGFLNTVTVPLTLLPLAAAALAGTLGLTVLFALILVGGLTYVLLALRMRENDPPPESD